MHLTIHVCAFRNMRMSTCQFFCLVIRCSVFMICLSMRVLYVQFLRSHHLSVADVLNLHLHPLLLQAPKKVRGKYGKRREVSTAQREALTRERNRDHARATRKRRRIFREVQPFERRSPYEFVCACGFVSHIVRLHHE